MRLRGDDEAEGKNMLKTFREKVEEVLKLEGSINEKVDESESVNFKGESVLRRAINISFILADPEFKEYEQGEEELSEESIERIIDRFYDDLSNKRAGGNKFKEKIIDISGYL